MTHPARPKRILLVEDEYLIAEDMAFELRAMGAEVLGPYPRVAAALGALEVEPSIDAAILDINLGGEMVFPVADALLARNVPVLFATGYDDKMIPARFGRVERCRKPVTRAILRQAIQKQLEST